MGGPNRFSPTDTKSLEVTGPPPLSLMNGNQVKELQILLEPQSLDVLCGKSKKCVDHSGSRIFRNMIVGYRENYQQALTKWDKTNVTRNIYDRLSQAGSRFLKYDETMKIWEEIPPMAARDKIGHALRFANKSTRRTRGVNCIGDHPTVSELRTQIVQPQQVQFVGMPSSLPLPQQILPCSELTRESESPPQTPLLQFLVCNKPTTAPSQTQPSFFHSGVERGQLQVQGLLTLPQSWIPLDRPEVWYLDKDTEDLKDLSKPAPSSESGYDSLSLLADIFPMNQSADHLPVSSSQDILPFDLDFDLEILSVLL